MFQDVSSRFPSISTHSRTNIHTDVVVAILLPPIEAGVIREGGGSTSETPKSHVLCHVALLSLLELLHIC